MCVRERERERGEKREGEKERGRKNGEKERERKRGQEKWYVEKRKTHTERVKTIGFVSLFNGISTFVGYLMPNLSIWTDSTGTIWHIAGRRREFMFFSRV